MTEQEVLAILETWEGAYRKLEAVLEALVPSVGRDPEAPLSVTVWEAFGVCTAMTARVIGVDPYSLEWWIWENNCGARGHECGLGDGVMTPMRTLPEYAKFLVAEAEMEADR